MARQAAAALRVEHISKTFPGARALDDVSLVIAPGEVHGLVGGNGSGKSTLIKILAGVHQADPGAGTVQVGRAEPVAAAALSPDWARSAGLHFVHQDPAVFPLLTVGDNIALGHGYPTRRPWQIRNRYLRRRTQEVLDRYGLDLRPTDMIEDLSAAQRSMVAIARALQDQNESSGGLLVLDEPTASLPGPEVSVLLAALRTFAASGQSILFVSHRTPEVLGFADHVSVLRDGRVVDTVDGAGLTEARLVELIVGRTLDALERDLTPSTGSTGTILDARNLYGRGLNGATLGLREGEVLGVAGLVGSGRSELLKALFGAHRIESGTVLLDGAPVRFANVGQAMDAGFAYVPEDRTIEASFPEMTVRENVSASDIMRYWKRVRMDGRAERDDAHAAIEQYDVRASSDTQVFSTLSGGNQQKVILARWLRRKPRILLLDEPTHGVDIGARSQIYKLITAAAARGTSILLVSSDNDELAILSDRVLVMVEGRITREIQGPGIDPDRIGELAIEPAGSPAPPTTRGAPMSSADTTGDTAPEPAVPVPTRHGRRRAALFAERYALLVGFIAMMIFFSTWPKTGHAFGAGANFQNTASAHAFLVILAMALLVPLLCGEFDLSVGQIAGASQIAAAVVMSKHGATFGEAIVVAVLFGAIVGFVNGNTVARVGVNSLIVTLGTSGVLLGIIQWYTQGNEVATNIHPSVANFGQLNSILGIPRTVLLAAAVVVVLWWVVNQTPYGRFLKSVGSNQRAAQLVGLPVPWIKLSAFVVSGALAGLAGVILFAQGGGGSPQAGSVLDTLQALAVVFLGATAIRPGRFNVEGTVIAIFFLAFTIQGLELAGLASYIAAVFNGAALFFAVIISTELRNRRTGRIGG